MAVTIAISMATPIMMEYAINVCVASGDVNGLLRLGALAVVMFLFLAGTKVRMYIMSDVLNKVLLNIRDELYQHIQTLSFGFFDSRPTGKILARIIGDVNFLKGCAVRQRDSADPGFNHGGLCRSYHADKELQAGHGGTSDAPDSGGGDAGD